MVSLVFTIIAFAGAMGIPAFLTAIVESAFKIRPSSSRTRASRGMNWTDRYRPVAIAMTSTKRTSIGQSLTDGWSIGRAPPSGPKVISNRRTKKAPAFRHGIVLGAGRLGPGPASSSALSAFGPNPQS
jgi:hypothetical protein